MLGSAENEKIRLISHKLFSKNSDLCDRLKFGVNVTDRQTDRRTDNLPWQYRALPIASRGKKQYLTQNGYSRSSYHVTFVLDLDLELDLEHTMDAS